MPAFSPTRCLRVFSRPGVIMPLPRPGIEPEDIVTPSQAGHILGVPASTIRTWIERYGLEPLGKLGRWNAYDFREIAAVEAALRRSAAA